MTYFLRSLLIATTTGILVSCSFNNPAPSLAPSSEHFRIISGSKAVAGAPISRSTVILNLPSGKFCSGVLLNDHVVLTAAHCVSSAMPGPAMGVVVPDEDKSCFNSSVTDISLAPKVAAGNKYPPDLALLKLRGAICKPAPVALEASPSASEVVTGGGFGFDTGPGRPDLLDMTVVGSDKESLRALYLNEDPQEADVLEDWKLIEENYEEFSEMYLFAVANNSEQSLCRGDSGGPVYREQNGVLHIIGVNGGGFPHSKKGVASCQNTYLQFFAPVGPSIEWIENTLKQWN